MTILRYTASADTTITNAFKANLSTRGTGSNMGYADSLEVFSIYGQLASGSSNTQSQELSRILIQFPITQMKADRTANLFPASGSVRWYLRMHNAETPFTLPQGYTLIINPVSSSWSEGTGLDMDEYSDTGAANWIKRSTTANWTAVGGDYGQQEYEVNFPQGYEDIELDVSALVEKWMDDTYDNYGIGVRLTGSEEAYWAGATTDTVIQNTNGATQSYYTKKFFARSTEFYFKRPCLEARWDARTLDNRGDFYFSSSLAPAPDNMMNLYLYNYQRGRLTNIPGVGTDGVRVKFMSGSTTASGQALSVWDGNQAQTYITGSYVSTGIYSCSVAITAAGGGPGGTPLQKIFDVWYSGSTVYQSSSFLPSVAPKYNSAPTFDYMSSVTNLRASYSTKETARFRVFIRNKDWQPTIYTVANNNPTTEVMPSASYSIVRVIDELPVVAYGTASATKHTYLSHDVTGNYFDLRMNLLEKGYAYKIKLAYYNGSIETWVEQPEEFKFRVEE